MVVAYRASSVSGAADSISNPRVINKPTGTVTDDVALVCIEYWSSTNPVLNVTPATGFFAVPGASVGPIAGGGGFVWMKAFYKPIPGGEGASWSFAHTGADGGPWSLAHAISISGADTVSPIDVVSVSSVVGSTTEPAPAVIATAADFLAFFVNRADAGSQSTVPPNYIEIQDGNVLTANYRILTGAATITPSGGVSSVSTSMCAIHIGVKPAGGAPATSDALKRDKQMRLGALLQM